VRLSHGRTVIEPGEGAAFLGPTRVRDLVPLYPGEELRIGGTVVNNLAPKQRGIAMVFQNYALYPHLSVADNMAFALKLKGISRSERTEKVLRAAKLLDLVPYLDRKPRALSGGQRQRLAIARSLVREADILVLDDALSAVDGETERRILDAMRARRGKVPTVVIAHRLSTLAEADRIVVLEGGRVADHGTHAELIARDGLYKRLWAIQAELEDEERAALVGEPTP
jgi:multiple sugar transport system ATP-binding protein